jgi:hypothetical protein
MLDDLNFRLATLTTLLELNEAVSKDDLKAAQDCRDKRLILALDLFSADRKRREALQQLFDLTGKWGHTNARLCRDTRGRHGGIREKLAAGMNENALTRLSPPAQTARAAFGLLPSGFSERPRLDGYLSRRRVAGAGLARLRSLRGRRL